MNRNIDFSLYVLNIAIMDKIRNLFKKLPSDQLKDFIKTASRFTYLSFIVKSKLIK